MQLKERAIILSKIKYGEADLIVKFITAEGEVYSAMAKSALKSQKRFGGGVLEPTHYVSLTLERRGGVDDERLAVLSESQILDDFRGLKSDYDRLDLAFHFIKIVTTVAREGDLHRDIFNLLGHALKSAETVQDLQFLKTQFNLKLLRLQGVLPSDEKYAPYLRASIREGISKTPEYRTDLEEYRQINREIEVIFANYIF